MKKSMDEKAIESFKAGMNCAQTVVTSFKKCIQDSIQIVNQLIEK